MSNKKHPTKIQGYVRKKVDNNQQQCNSEASEEKNMVKYGMDVISMCVVPVQLKHGESCETLEIYTLLNSCSQVTFILDRLLTSFGIKGKRMSRTI